MSYITIKDFQRGLDTRKFELSQPAGTLTRLINGHITPGGEIEKRKAFAKLSPSLPAGTYGLQETNTGILVFGSADLSGASFPSPFTYQRLRHPAVLDGTTYDAAKHAMTKLVSSTLYGRAAFAVAKFADGKVFCYYDGSLVADFTAGVVLSHLNTNAKIATHIVSLLAQTGSYASSAQVGSTAELDIVGPAGATYAVATSKVSTAGTITPQIKDNGLAPVNGKQSVGQFAISAGTTGAGVNYISAVKLKNGSTVIVSNLLSASVNFATTIYDTAIAVANNISANSGATGYYAIAVSNTVNIFKLAIGSATNGYDLEVTAAGNVCIGNCVVALTGDPTGGILSIVAGTTSIAGDVVVGTISRARYAVNVAYLVTSQPHGLVVGNKFSTAGIGGTGYNAINNVVVSVPTPYSLSYASTGSIETTSVASTARERTATTCTITTASAHGLQIGSLVTVAAGTGGTGYAVTLAAVTAIPSSTKFSYLASSGSTPETSTADATKTVTLPVSDTTGVVTTSDSVVAGQTSLTALATLAQDSINAHPTAGYNACAVGNLLYLSKSTTSSADTDITVTIIPGTGLIVGDVASTGLQVGLSAYTMAGGRSLEYLLNSQGTLLMGWNTADETNTTQPVSVTISGSTAPPYTFNWVHVSSENYVNGVLKNNAVLIAIDSKSSFTTTFSLSGSDSFLTNAVGNPSGYRNTCLCVATFKCEVTDNNGTMFTSALVTVSFSLTPVRVYSF